MTKLEFKALLSRYLLGDCTNEEKVTICEWFKKIEFDRQLFLNKEEHSFTENKIFKSIEEKINEGKNIRNDELPFNGFLNSCLIYAGTIESIILIETFNADLLFT